MSNSEGSLSPGRKEKDGRPRQFDSKAKSWCWAKADVLVDRHPERWRKDAVGNIVCQRFFNCNGCLCYEYDHIIPFSKGGESVADNCQILQTRVNRLKSAKDEVDKTKLKDYSCDIAFTVFPLNEAKMTPRLPQIPTLHQTLMICGSMILRTTVRLQALILLRCVNFSLVPPS